MDAWAALKRRSRVQARMAADVESLQYELLDPDDPSGVQQQPRREFGKDRPVVILGFNEASQARRRMHPHLIT